MNREELRVLFADEWAGSGWVLAPWRTVHHLLSLHPLYEPDHQAEFQETYPDHGVQMILLYRLCHLGLIDYGTSIDSGWLTDKGREVLDALDREKADAFTVLGEPSCIHGFVLEDLEHDCMSYEKEKA